MKRGEVSKFTIKPEYGYGAAGSPGMVPPNATLIYEITCITWRYYTKNKYDYKVEERQPLGIEFKNKGNAFFKAGDIESAKKVYSQAVHFLEDDNSEEAKTTIVAVWQNMSLIYFKDQSYELARSEATKAIKKDSSAVIFFVNVLDYLCFLVNTLC